MLQSFRYLLFPFSFLYGIVIRIRNLLFDRKLLKSTSFNFPIVCIGNLAMGGTGKTPMVEEIIRLLQHEKKVAVLSRGYMRKSKGVVFAGADCTAIDIGDEPMQIHQKFPDVVLAVSEERLVGIPQILHQYPKTEVIVLDDAFQHRKVKAGLNIMLTEYSNLFTRDYFFPVGDLRDERKSSKRADVIIVTKSPLKIDASIKESISKEITTNKKQKVLFTSISYGQPYHLFSGDSIKLESDHHILLVSGIANPSPLKKYLTEQVASFEMLRYRDHHIFSFDDLKDIKTTYDRMTDKKKIVITTQKDAVRLYKYKSEIEGFPIYVLPIRHVFHDSGEEVLKEQLLKFIHQTK